MPLAAARPCFLLLALAAGSGAVPAEDASTLVQRQAAPLASTHAGALNVESLRSVLQVAQDDLAKRSAQARHLSRGGKEQVGLGDIKSKLREATRFLADRLAKLNATTTHVTDRGGSCKGWCTASIVLDGLAIAFETNLFVKSQTEKLCTLPLLLMWWITGVGTLMEDQKLDFFEAILVLVEQLTSIGYGSNTPPTNSTGLRIFHGLHEILSQMPIARVIGEAADEMLNLLGEKPFKVVQTLALAVASATFFFAGDLHTSFPATYPKYVDALVDGLYETLDTVTTIGYGQLIPSSNWSKFSSPLALPLLTGAFARFAGGFPVDSGSSRPLKEQLCSCFGENTC